MPGLLENDFWGCYFQRGSSNLLPSTPGSQRGKTKKPVPKHPYSYPFRPKEVTAFNIFNSWAEASVHANTEPGDGSSNFTCLKHAQQIPFLFLLNTPLFPTSVKAFTIFPASQAPNPGDTLLFSCPHTHIQPSGRSCCHHLLNTPWMLPPLHCRCSSLTTVQNFLNCLPLLIWITSN